MDSNILLSSDDKFESAIYDLLDALCDGKEDPELVYDMDNILYVEDEDYVQ